MKAFVTGAAGFIGSTLCDALLVDGWSVTGWDNFSTGRENFLKSANLSDRFKLIRGDNLDRSALNAAMGGSEIVFHFAANADVRFGLDHPERDLEQNTIATFYVLEAMRKNGVKKIVFSSTGSTYGEAAVIPTPEDAPFPIQTSLYGASKLACEGMISAYTEGFGFRGLIFRFVSLLGERYTHGHIFDFYRQLQEHPDHLNVLGDGTQRKSYLYVKDCIRAIQHVIAQDVEKPDAKLDIYNLGTNEYCTVKNSIGWICATMGISPELRFTGGNRGWVGDNPFIFLDTKKIRSTGWEPELTIKDGVEKTVRYLSTEPWLFV